MIRKYLFVIKKERNDGDYDLVYLDYRFEKINKLFKKAEKLLKQKSKKEGIHSGLEEKIVEDLIDIDIIQMVI